MLDIDKLLKIAKVVGDVIHVAGPAAAELKAKLAAARVEVTEAEWDALTAGFQRVEDIAERERKATS